MHLTYESLAGAALSPSANETQATFSDALARAGRAGAGEPMRTDGAGAMGPREGGGGETVGAPQAIASWAQDLVGAQQKLDEVLTLARSGRSFTAAELLALQSQVYQASQNIDLTTKLVEKVSTGAKQILQTQL